MRILLLLSLLLSAGCASLGTKSTEDQVKMPEVQNPKSKEFYIQHASKNKIRIGSRLNQNFDFFYGPNGSYFIVVSSQGNRIDLSAYEVMLKINSLNRANPEQISMAVEDAQVVSGFGEFREGITLFEVQLSPIHPEFNPSFQFQFEVDLKPAF